MASRNKYWICIVGDANQKKLPQGCDSPMRNAVNEEFKDTTGHYPKELFSGWGNSKEMVDVINYVWSMSEDDKEFKELLNKAKEQEKIFQEFYGED